MGRPKRRDDTNVPDAHASGVWLLWVCKMIDSSNCIAKVLKINVKPH